MARNLSAFHDVRFMPRYLAGIEPPDLTTKILGQTHAAPFGPAPVGLTGLMWPDAPLHILRAAAKHGLAGGLSSVATNSVEEGGASVMPRFRQTMMQAEMAPPLEAGSIEIRASVTLVAALRD